MPFPISILILDLFGALMVALAIVEIGEPGALVPPQYAFPHYPLVLLVLGSLLMWPMVRHMIKRARQKTETPRRRR